MFRAISKTITPIITRSFQNNFNKNVILTKQNLYNCQHNCGFKSTATCRDVMEFFDEKKYWSEPIIKVGRSWNIEELRLKSNVDLHKLWYVLLKERNMLLTMEHACKEEFKLFPNPERIDKVNDSMANLETVVRERNRAYHLLETGKPGERQYSVMKNALGLRVRIREQEHYIPRYLKSSKYPQTTFASRKFISLYKEKISGEKRKSRNRDKNHVLGLLKRFPNIDKEVLQNKYPTVNVEKLSTKRKADGHSVNE